MGQAILADINIASTSTSTGSWVDMTGMSISSVTVGATGNVVLLMAQVNINPQGDSGAEFRFTVNGSSTNSPVITAFADSATNDEAHGMTLLWAVTGLSGSSNSFALQWTTIGSAASADTTRNRTFQILEIDAADCTLEVDQGTTGQTGDPASWGNLFQATGVSITGTSSVIIMLGNVPINLEADEGIDFQFGVDDTGDGAVTSCYTDAANEGNGWSGMHILDGLSAATHTFELKWQARTGAGQTDGSRRRTFQVIELTANAALQLDLNVASSQSAPGTFADVTGLSDSYTVASTNAIALINANMVQLGDAQDSTADYSLGVDGTNEGAELIGMTDNTNLVGRVSMQRLKTGLSNASHSFQLRWLEIGGGTVADTGRDRTLQVIEFTDVTYKLDGITYDKDAVALGSVECYLYRDNGDNTLTWLAYQLSNSSTGVFSFTGLPDNNSEYLIVFFKDDAPTVMDVTDHNLTPVVE